MESVYKQRGIYKIVNMVNGKAYIGKTGMNFGDRWDSHRALLRAGKHSNAYLQRAWDKYGEDAFRFEIVCIENCVDALNDLEKFYISEYRAVGLCYNILDGGDGGTNLGSHLSEETKRKIGDKNRVNMTGRKVSPETRAKMSASQKARYASWTDSDRAAYGKSISKYASGYRWSEEARARFSEMQRIKPNGSKLTADDVRAIRAKFADGVGYSELSGEYSVSQTAIRNIIARRRWAYID